MQKLNKMTNNNNKRRNRAMLGVRNDGRDNLIFFHLVIFSLLKKMTDNLN